MLPISLRTTDENYWSGILHAYNIDILPQLLLFDIAYNLLSKDRASMITTISILKFVFLNNIHPEISLIMQQISRHIKQD